MIRPFVDLNADLAGQLGSAVCLVPTERLRRELLRAYDLSQVEAGRSAWPTARIYTLDGYLTHLQRRLLAGDPNAPDVLSPEAEFHLFRTTAPDGATPLTHDAQEAWTLCQSWGIPTDSRLLQQSSNGRLFAGWCARVGQRLESQGWLTRAQLCRQKALAADHPELVCFAFEQLPTSYRLWLDRQAARGIRIRYVQPPSVRADGPRRLVYDSPQLELADAARWARQILSEHGGEARVGVVVPDLAGRHQAVSRAFTAMFDPLLESGGQGLFDLGGGTPLGRSEAWRAARAWLNLCFLSLPAGEARRCVLSPYLQLPAWPAMTAESAAELDARQIAAIADTGSWDTVVAGLPPGHRVMPLADWLITFEAALAKAGWPGTGTGSVQYQVWQMASQRLAALARVDGAARSHPVTATGALDVLDQHFEGVTFAPERAPAPVQVLGVLETTGLTFTHLRVIGLDDRSWPGPPTTNPFLPVALRKAHGVPRATPEEERAFAESRLSHWQQVTGELLLSHARTVDGSERGPSPLTARFPEAGSPEPITVTHPAFRHRPRHLEQVEDLMGLPLPAGNQSGGTRRFQDQARCPFRGYAVHRLQLADPRPPHDLPDAVDRGLLVHEALHALYRSAIDKGPPPGHLPRARIEAAVDQAIRRRLRRFPESYRHRERTRLIALLERWEDLEAKRSGVQVEALEHSAIARFGSIDVELRMDRIDRVHGNRVVIDYKTGQHTGDLSDPRLPEPQLPMYALADPDITAVLFATVREDGCQLSGVSAQPLDATRCSDPEQGSWEAQRRLWRDRIQVLADEIGSGHAAVTPHTPEVCRHCHLGDLCRIALPGEAPDL